MMNVFDSKNTLEAYISYRRNYLDKEPFNEERLLEALKTSIEVLKEVENLIYSTHSLGMNFYKDNTNDYVLRDRKTSMQKHISALQKLTELRNPKPKEE